MEMSLIHKPVSSKVYIAIFERSRMSKIILPNKCSRKANKHPKNSIVKIHE